MKAGEDGWVDVVVKVQSWSDVMNFHSRGRGNKAIWGIRSVGNSKFYYPSFPPQQNKPKPGKGHTKIGSHKRIGNAAPSEGSRLIRIGILGEKG